MTARIVTVTNRGLGLELPRSCAADGDTVLLGCRDPRSGCRAADELASLPGRVVPVELDVTDADGLGWLTVWVSGEVGRVDVLVNNAAIHDDTGQNAAGADLDIAREALEPNVFGAWRTTQAFLPLLRRSPRPRPVMVSSESGSLASMVAGTPAYHVSKAGLNASGGRPPTWAVTADGR